MRHELLRVACLTLAAAILPFVSRANAQISPGPLSAAHASLDGPLNCAKCHAGGKESMTSRCVSCHREITWLVERNRGFHARAGRADCSSCHPDHAGRDFALIKWPDGGAQRFDHARTGWALDGKHARLACEKCHTESFRTSPAAALAPKGTTPGGWVGLETTCASCHQDVHKSSLGRTCESCHTTTGWSPAPKFDHGRTQYPLTGKHAAVACDKCHTMVAGHAADGSVLLAQFKPLAHADCVSCHRDPHQGRLTGACSSCHLTTSFASVEGRTFSHDRTRYPLRGLHASVPCASCHAGYPARIDRPAFATCAGCHGDTHAKRGTVGGAATDCASCHSVAGFKPSTFTLARHAQSTRCASCHVDAHAGQLATSPGAGECKACHAPSGWKPSTFGVREHATLRFALTGRHAQISCASCHSATRRGPSTTPATGTIGSASVALKLDATTCDACHNDPHGGRYRAATSAQGTCASCHDTRAFRPSTIDVQAHSRFSFALEGAHRAAPCVACHTTMRGTSSYAIPNATCATCHATPHGAQFAKRPDGGACQSCHDLNGWTPASRFVHDANGGFVLGAAHAKVSCASCHAPSANSSLPRQAANAARTWHGVPRNCEACHRSGTGL
jgi:hypothetical protein